MPDPTSSDFDEISAELEAEAPVDWDPEAETTLVGTVTGIERTETKIGEVNVVTIKTQDGRLVRVFASRMRLRKQLASGKVQPGDAVGLKYLGQVDGQAGRPYFDYRVIVKRRGPRDEAEMFRDVEADDLVPGIEQAADPWKQEAASQETLDEAPV